MIGTSIREAMEAFGGLFLLFFGVPLALIGVLLPAGWLLSRVNSNEQSISPEQRSQWLPPQRSILSEVGGALLLLSVFGGFVDDRGIQLVAGIASLLGFGCFFIKSACRLVQFGRLVFQPTDAPTNVRRYAQLALVGYAIILVLFAFVIWAGVHFRATD